MSNEKSGWEKYYHEKEKVEILDSNDEDFDKKLEFALWSTGGSSDYRNDRERPYNGQTWTDEGLRGKTEVKGLTMRDIRDCLIKGFILSGATKEYLEPDEFMKCWDFSSGEAKPTQYLLDNQDRYVFTKVEIGNWRQQDVYKLDLSNIDPIAVAQNMSCEIEKMMGIFPNIKK